MSKPAWIWPLVVGLIVVLLVFLPHRATLGLITGVAAYLSE
jgi:hypothetical protein